MRSIAGFLIVALGWLTWTEGGFIDGVLALFLMAGGMMVAMFGGGPLLSLSANKKKGKD